MKRLLLSVTILLVLLSAITTHSRSKESLLKYNLTDEQILLAIEEGTNWRKTKRLRIIDSGKAFWTAMVADAATTTPEGYKIEVYTPTSWIAHNSFLKKQKYLQMALKDVDEEMRRSVLRVLVFPSTGSLSANLVYEANHVVVLSAKKKNPGSLQPISIQRLPEKIFNLLGLNLDLNVIQANFDMAEVKRLSDEHKKGEFYIAVVGESNKKFKIKKNHLKKLP